MCSVGLEWSGRGPLLPALGMLTVARRESAAIRRAASHHVVSEGAAACLKDLTAAAQAWSP